MPHGRGSAAPAAAVADATEGAYLKIRRRILVGDLAPGSAVSQVRLAAELGISRTPLREAIRQLVTEGLLTSDFNRQVRVTELDLNDFDEIYAMRMSLEPLAVAASVPTVTDADLAALAGAFDGMSAAIEAEDDESFRLHHRDFHLVFAASTGPRLQRSIGTLWDHSERYRRVYLRGDDDGHGLSERYAASQVDHHAILQAAVARDADACAHHLLEHLDRTVQGVYIAISSANLPRLSARARRTQQGMLHSS